MSVQVLGRSQRVARAARVCVPLLGGAILSLPIPGWHLVAVPGFLAAAIVTGVRRLRQDRIALSLEGPCPACGADQELRPIEPSRLPAIVPCPACGAYLKLRPGGREPAPAHAVGPRAQSLR